ncbi:MAG: hypothetical protein KDD38_08770 [Bdellovibrionales bacterium]|nr:hypothetical protein [Bdellovibrionales bacterium]
MSLLNHGMQWAGGAPQKKPGCRKNQRKFWSYLIFSRIVSWGREFKTVIRYVQKNTLEALNLIAYQPRNKMSLIKKPTHYFSGAKRLFNSS